MNFNGVELTFDESIDSIELDGNRKYVLFIRKSTEKEKIFFNSFVESNIIQFKSRPITTRLSDWYPLEINYITTTNQYKYGTLFNTEVIVVESDDEEIVKEKK